MRVKASRWRVAAAALRRGRGGGGDDEPAAREGGRERRSRCAWRWSWPSLDNDFYVAQKEGVEAEAANGARRRALA